MKHSNNILIKRNLSFISAVLLWIFLFVVPMIVVKESIQVFLVSTTEKNIMKGKELLANEMYQFKKDFTFSSYLRSTLQKIINDHKFNTGSNNIQGIANKLSQNGIRASFLISHGRDTQNLQFYYSNEVQSKKAEFPVFLTKNLFSIINKQYLHSLYDSDLKSKFDRRYRKNTISKQSKMVFAFLQKKLNLVSSVNIEDRVVCNSISGVLNSQIYMLYFSIKENIEQKNYIKGGVFLVVKASDINFKKLQEYAKLSSNKDIVRNYSVLSNSVKDFGTKKLFRISSFSQDINGVYFQIPYPHSTLVNYIQEGSLVPKKLDESMKHLPLMKVTLPSHKFKHQFEKYYHVVKWLLNLFVLLGAIALLRSYFFGLEFNISLRSKLIIGIVMIFFAPLILSGFSMYVYSQVNFDKKQRDRLGELEQYSDKIQKQYHDFLVYKQMKVVKFAQQLNKVINNKKQNQDKFIADWLEKNTAVDVAIKHSSLKLKTFYNRSVNKKRLVKNMTDIARTIFIKSVYAVAVLGRYVDSGRGFSTEVTNDLLLQNGKFVEYRSLSSENVFSTVKITNASGLTRGIIMVRFMKNDLISEFIDEVAKKMANEYAFKQRINTAFCQLNDNGIPYLRYSNLKKDKGIIPDKVFLSAEQKTSMKYSYLANNMQYSCVIKYYLPFSFITYAVYKEPVMHIGYGLPLLFLLYMVVFITFIYVLFGQIYLEPIKSFVSVAKEIEKGNYTASAISSNILEFYHLRETFDNMTYGLEQKETLAKFVSKDVLDAVEAKDEISAGGVKIEATVLFISIYKFEDFVDTNSAESIMHLMNAFISLAEVEIDRFHGVIDKIIDGSLMVIFKENLHAEDSARAVLSIRKSAQNERIVIKAGFATGEIVSGKIGSRNGRLDLTVIGDTVNLAARLKAEAIINADTTGIIISPASIRKIKGKAKLRFLKRTNIKGKSREYPLYELLGMRS